MWRFSCVLNDVNFTICVYAPDCPPDFSNNGLGVLTPMSRTVTETLNGEYELTLEHPEPGRYCLHLSLLYISTTLTITWMSDNNQPKQ